MQIIFVALAQFAGDHRFGFAHVIDRSLNGDNTLKIEAIDIVDTTDGDLCIGVLHNSLDCVTTLSNDSTDEIVVSKDLQGNLTVDKQCNNIINITIQLSK